MTAKNHTDKMESWSDMINLHPYGTPCFLNDGKIPATILRAQIGQNGSVLYEVAWYNGGNYCEVWIAPCEISATAKPCQPIGLVATNKTTPDCRALEAVARAASKLLAPPYRRPGLTCDDRERADWRALDAALLAAGIDGERLT